MRPTVPKVQMTKSAGAASSPLTVASGESSTSTSSDSSSDSDSGDERSTAASPKGGADDRAKSPSRRHQHKHSHRKHGDEDTASQSPRRSPSKSPRPVTPAEKKDDKKDDEKKKEEKKEDFLESKEYQRLRAEFVERWNGRQYDACLEAIGGCVDLLGASVAAAREAQRAPDAAVVRELSLVVAYRVAVHILKDIIRLSSASNSSSAGADDSEKTVATVALRAKFLAELPLHGPHRIDCIRLAIDKNMAARNYGVACRLLQVLLQHRLPDSRALQDKYDVCAAHKWADASLPPYTCPGCGRPASPASTECACDMPIKFCCQSFALLQDRVVTHCALCRAIYAQTAVPAGTPCPLCGCAPVDAFDVYAEVQKRKQQQQQQGDAV